MPFRERGTQDLLDRVHEGANLRLSSRIEEAADARFIVLTLGTPNLWHIEIDISDIRSVLDSLLPVLRAGHALVLRSTVAPGTTEFVAGYLEQQRGFELGRDIYVAHAPERIAETRPDYVLILPWNLTREIAAQLEYVRDWGGRLVVPIPEPTVLP